MPEFVTLLFVWLLFGSLVWMFYQTAGLIERGAFMFCMLRRLDGGSVLYLGVSIAIIVNWPAFAFLFIREVIRAFAAIAMVRR